MDVGTVAGTYGPWGIVAFAVLAVLRGWIVPREVVEDVRKELSYNRERIKELEAQRNLAWAEAAKMGVTLSQLPAAPPEREGS
jgi:hypothetical protein